MTLPTTLHSRGRRIHLVYGSETTDPSLTDERKFADAVRDGLQARPKTLPFAYFYDEHGSALFERICRLPEYYPTRTEDAILQRHAADMVSGWAAAPTLIELGSGSAEKTRRLIGAAVEKYGRVHYVAMDVSPTAVEASSEALIERFPELRVTGLIGDYHDQIATLGTRFPGPKLIIFLGSSLGNYEVDDASDLLTRIARVSTPNDRFLLGTDLVKDARVLEAAYDDVQGVTAEFNLNLLTRINHAFQADFDLDLFRHRAVFNQPLKRVEMHLVSLKDQVVTIAALGLEIPFVKEETIHTENSHKYTVDALSRLADRAGFREDGAWTDTRSYFRVQRWQVR